MYQSLRQPVIHALHHRKFICLTHFSNKAIQMLYVMKYRPCSMIATLFSEYNNEAFIQNLLSKSNGYLCTNYITIDKAIKGIIKLSMFTKTAKLPLT